MRIRLAALALVSVLLAAGCPAKQAIEQPQDAGMTAEQLQREKILADAMRGLQCPGGTRRVGDEPPAGFETWCEKTEGVREGPYRAWHPDGTKSVVGQYLGGQRDGDWAEWYQNGQRKNESVCRRKHFGTPAATITA